MKPVKATTMKTNNNSKKKPVSIFKIKSAIIARLLKAIKAKKTMSIIKMKII